jgi:hypothetical protein
MSPKQGFPYTRTEAHGGDEPYIERHHNQPVTHPSPGVSSRAFEHNEGQLRGRT